MTSPYLAITRWVTLASLAVVAATASAEVLTVDDAVRIALQNSPTLKNSSADVLDAQGALKQAYSGVLPRVSASVSRYGQTVTNQSGGRNVGGIIGAPDTQVLYDFESHGTTPQLTGSWDVLDLAALGTASSARKSAKAADMAHQATRNDVVYRTKAQYYETVKAVWLSFVADSALKLSRDNERRVRALFEVGSVSKNDLLKAQVATANAQLDSLTNSQAAINQRILLAEALGIKESEMPEVATTFEATPATYDEATLLKEATEARPDLRAVEAELAAARAGVGAARWSYLPYVTLGGTMQFNTTSTSTSTLKQGDLKDVTGTTNDTDRQMSGQVALNWTLFDGLAREGRNQAAKARLIRAEETHNALFRNLQSEVHQAVLLYQAAIVGEEVARRSLDSAAESMKLSREKYNVGSATILDLIDAQVSEQRAAANLVSARAVIKVAEARIEQVRGGAR